MFYTNNYNKQTASLLALVNKRPVSETLFGTDNKCSNHYKTDCEVSSDNLFVAFLLRAKKIIQKPELEVASDSYSPNNVEKTVKTRKMIWTGYGSAVSVAERQITRCSYRFEYHMEQGFVCCLHFALCVG